MTYQVTSRAHNVRLVLLAVGIVAGLAMLKAQDHRMAEDCAPCLETVALG